MSCTRSTRDGLRNGALSKANFIKIIFGLVERLFPMHAPHFDKPLDILAVCVTKRPKIVRHSGPKDMPLWCMGWGSVERQHLGISGCDKDFRAYSAHTGNTHPTCMHGKHSIFPPHVHSRNDISRFSAPHTTIPSVYNILKYIAATRCTVKVTP